jgi:hypothetical protein
MPAAKPAIQAAVEFPPNTLANEAVRITNPAGLRALVRLLAWQDSDQSAVSLSRGFLSARFSRVQYARNVTISQLAHELSSDAQ